MSTDGPWSTGAPYFDDLSIGAVAEVAPAITLTEGHAAVHQAIVGDRLHLSLDAPLSARVTGGSEVFAHPSLVCDVAIGQSTIVTQRVLGNLFYRGLILRRATSIGDTLRTTVEVVALRQNSPSKGRAATGMAVLRVRTVDQERRPVLDFFRCAMLPLRDPDGETGHADDFAPFGDELDPAALRSPIEGWRLDEFRQAIGGPRLADFGQGSRWSVSGGDVVTAAPELARLTLNVASAHHDLNTTSSGRRLVYGGHTIGLAASQVCRAIPSLVTIVAWHSCDHLGPVFEGDTLHTEVELERAEALDDGGLLHLRARTAARREERLVEVLDWRFVAVIA